MKGSQIFINCLIRFLFSSLLPFQFMTISSLQLSIILPNMMKSMTHFCTLLLAHIKYFIIDGEREKEVDIHRLIMTLIYTKSN